MRPFRIIPVVLALLLAGCAGQNEDVVGPPPPSVLVPAAVQLVGVLDVEGDSSIALLYGGTVVPLLGLDPVQNAQLDGHEVVVEGRWEGDAFRAFSLTTPGTIDTPIDPPAEPEIRLPVR